MYNMQLETFIRVADAGSFSKAAEENHITPTAVIKQINSLEAALDLRLFNRTHRGVTLTESGRSLYGDAKYVIAFSKESVQRAKNVTADTDNIVRVGTSPMTPGEILFDLRPKIHELCPDIMFRFIPFANTPKKALEILCNLGRDIDIVAGWFDETWEEKRACSVFKLRNDPIYCAISTHHKLAVKDSLTIDDIRSESLMIIYRGWNKYVDKLRDFVASEQIKIIDFDFYNLDVFNQCENSNNVLMAFESWANTHPLIKVLPVEWDFTVPYGLFHSPNPSQAVNEFIHAIKHALEL